MNKQITVADLIAQYIKIRDMLANMQAELDARLKPYKDGLEAIEGAITAQLLALGEDEGKRNISFPGIGVAFRQQWTSAKVADREAFLDFVFNGEERQFVTAHVSKEAVTEWLAEHNGALPPGIDFTKGWKTIIRKG